MAAVVAPPRLSAGAAVVDVVVIGAGAAGLSAAQALSSTSLSCVVLEANSVIGGRIRQEELSPGVVVESGAELLHGRRTSATILADEEGWRRRRVCVWAQGDGGPMEESVGGGVALYFDGKGDGEWYRHDSKDGRFERMNSIIDNMAEEEVEEGDVRNMREALKDSGVDGDMLAMAEAGYANTLGSSLACLNWREMCKMERFWLTEGEDDSRLEGSNALIINHLARGIDIKTGCVVEKIEHGGGGGGGGQCIVHYRRSTSGFDGLSSPTSSLPSPSPLTSYFQSKGSAGGERLTLRCHAVIVTVSLGVMKAGCIEFAPPLPPPTLSAINLLGWAGDTVKLHLLFSATFWQGGDIHGIIASNCPVPEIWFDSRPRRAGEVVKEEGGAAKGRGGEVEGGPINLNVVSGFAMDSFAANLLKMGEEGAINTFLAQLDRMFSNIPSKLFVRGKWSNWSMHPYVRGGYSFPERRGSEEARAQLASPHAACGGGGERGGNVYFAGEHTGLNQCTTIHAAMDTGRRAAALAAQAPLSHPRL